MDEWTACPLQFHQIDCFCASVAVFQLLRPSVLTLYEVRKFMSRTHWTDSTSLMISMENPAWNAPTSILPKCKQKYGFVLSVMGFPLFGHKVAPSPFLWASWTWHGILSKFCEQCYIVLQVICIAVPVSVPGHFSLPIVQQSDFTGGRNKRVCKGKSICCDTCSTWCVCHVLISLWVLQMHWILGFTRATW